MHVGLRYGLSSTDGPLGLSLCWSNTGLFSRHHLAGGFPSGEGIGRLWDGGVTAVTFNSRLLLLLEPF